MMMLPWVCGVAILMLERIIPWVHTGDSMPSLLVEQLFWRGALDSWDVLDTGPLVVDVVTLLLFGLGSVHMDGCAMLTSLTGSDVHLSMAL